MSAVSDPALIGWIVALVVLGMAGLAKWLLGRLARQYEAMERQMADVGIRLARVEYDVANDKAGRAAFAETRAQIAVLTQSVQHLAGVQAEARRETREDIQNLWSRLNRQGGSNAA